ncbi:MAG: NADH-quinone oxidoreductase subunit NuoE [Myxococcota bacterium]|nr:NADH-quinone oxidoreductase subunit NuoE [Myxococcota bacterium]
MAFTLSAEHEKLVDDLVARYPTKQAACIPVLHLCQKQIGWVSPEIVDFVAARLGMATSEVKGVVTFYTMYHQHPPGKHTIWVCRTLSCDLMGAKTIQEHLERRLGCHVGQTSPDGAFTLKKAECLAACGYGPMVQVDETFYENLTVEKLDAILDRVARGETPTQEESAWVPNEPAPTGVSST